MLIGRWLLLGHLRDGFGLNHRQRRLFGLIAIEIGYRAGRFRRVLDAGPDSTRLSDGIVWDVAGNGSYL